MSRPDLNLLVTLDVLLSEGSVARAARRLKLSPSAMSRALARLRDTVGDPLLVRAGRGLVPTPRALALRGQVGQLVHDAEAVLRPTADVDLRALARTFTLRTSEGFVETFGPALIARTLREAPHVRLRFAPKPDKSSDPLREGSVDLETGVVDGLTGPELLTQALFHDRLVGVVRPGHALSKGRVTAARYAREQHVSVARAGKESIDEALEQLGLAREIAIVLAGGFATAIALARETDLVAAVPARHTQRLREGMHSFALPFATPEFTVSLLWHPRLDADAAHRWLRGTVRDVCREQLKRPPRDATPAAKRTPRRGAR